MAGKKKAVVCNITGNNEKKSVYIFAVNDEEENDEPVETEEKMKKEFIVDGMTCNHCRMHVEHALNALDGVKANLFSARCPWLW